MSMQSANQAVATRVVFLCLAVAAFLVAREYLLVTWLPAELNDLSLQQMRPDDRAAQDLRSADSTKNWLSTGWAVLVFAGVVAAGLFHRELMQLIEPETSEAEVGVPAQDPNPDRSASQ
jgi:hypothetical protein